MKACIFDLDGTLTDTLDSMVYSVNLTLQEMGLTEISRDQCRRFVGNGARKLIEDALNAADKMAEKTTERYTHEEVFAKWREVMQGKGGALNCMKLSFPMV